MAQIFEEKRAMDEFDIFIRMTRSLRIPLYSSRALIILFYMGLSRLKRLI